VIGALAAASHKMRWSLEELRTSVLPVLLDTADRISARMR